jgi:hypothetical protein
MSHRACVFGQATERGHAPLRLLPRCRHSCIIVGKSSQSLAERRAVLSVEKHYNQCVLQRSEHTPEATDSDARLAMPAPTDREARRAIPAQAMMMVMTTTTTMMMMMMMMAQWAYVIARPVQERRVQAAMHPSTPLNSEDLPPKRPFFAPLVLPASCIRASSAASSRKTSVWTSWACIAAIAASATSITLSCNDLLVSREELLSSTNCSVPSASGV